MNTLQSATRATTTIEQPRKLFYRINEVAKMTGLKPYVLRYWEREFPDLRPEKDAADQRRYRQKDIEAVHTIRRLLYDEGFTIRGARQRLKAELRSGAKAARSRRTAAAKPAGRKKPRAGKHSTTFNSNLGETLYHLRNEVADLLKILG